ncbi:helicase-associated domain-containing protein, partial [uncultured Treponema sp.]|uniref:helicase-associated domain-containing protein n=1 Tax=uncultured Treponema sp. TaxID=162155 RepID=UPI002592FA95
IIRWRESLATMPDERFFEIIRIYLGEIHTPFNKDRLIEQLSSIFRKEQTKKTITAFLSEFDIKMLSAISIVPSATQEKLAEFFSGEHSLSDIYSELLNLNERLLIYTYKDLEANSSVIAVNPLLEEVLSPFIGVSHLFRRPECISRNLDVHFSLSPLFLASFISYIESYPDLCRNDLSIKKKDIERLGKIFPKKEKCLSLILNALINLGIARLGEKELSVDEKRLAKFASLPECRQYAYLSVASAAHFGRESLRSQAQLLLDIAATVPPEGFSRSSLLRTAFLLNNTAEIQRPAQSTFSRILEARTRSLSDAKITSGTADAVIDSAIEFGLFVPYGTDEGGEVMYVRSGVMQENEPQQPGSKRGLLNINAGTSITVMPGLSLSELLPLVSFMDVTSSSTVTEFEVTRKSVSRAFDKNSTPSDIYELLSCYSAYEIPQSLQMNIEEWYSSYSSAILYKGYVLKVNEKSARVVENSPGIAPYIQAKLADGIYVMNIPLDDDAEKFIRSCGLDFMGTVRTPKRTDDVIDFPVLRSGRNVLAGRFVTEEQMDCGAEKTEDGAKIKEGFYKKLDELELTEQQRECLAMRIERNVIVTEEQLKPETVRLEILEIDGMNYAGKLRLIENTIDSGDSIELTVPADNDPSRLLVYLGKPLMISKHTNDALVRMQLEPDNEIRFFSVSRANKVKIIRTSVFK